MTSKTLKTARSQRPANSSLVAAATGDRKTVASNGGATASRSPHSGTSKAAEVATSSAGRLQGGKERHRTPSSAEPLAAFRATGDTPWKKAERNEVAAVQVVGEFGLLSTQQIAEWVFKDLSTPSARLRQAQALTLRLCPAARAHSTSGRLATAGRRPVLRALGRKKVGEQHYYYLNACGRRLFRERNNLSLPDAAKSLTTVIDMARRELVFEHVLTLRRADPALVFWGRATLAAAATGQDHAETLVGALLLCLSHLWCCRGEDGKLTYTYVADSAGSSSGVKFARYREVAKAASEAVGKDIQVDIIGRRLQGESAIPLTDTRLAKSVVAASKKEIFWGSHKKRYEVQKLVVSFASLKRWVERLRNLMEARGA